MAVTPENASDSMIARLFGDDLALDKSTAAAIDRINDLMKPATTVPELFFSTSKRRHMEYERVPVGHDTGYRCYDATKHNNAQEAFEAGEYGDGMSKDESYVAWLRNDCPAPCDCEDIFCEDHDRRTQQDIENERAVDDALDERTFGDER